MSRKAKADITKQFIIDQLTDNEVDLSMNELTTVPVKELALVTRGTRLDLSRNHLKHLPENFGALRHLIGLDLSGNKLQSLPNSFGQLVLLQKLDLYNNQLTTLPLTFWNLKKLKWLDLKNNPLEDGLRNAAGTCVSSKECNHCATKVLSYMKLQLSKSDRDKHFTLDRKRLMQDKLRIEEDTLTLRKEAMKKEKELRKRIRAEQFRQAQEEKERVKVVEAEEVQRHNLSNQGTFADNIEKRISLRVGSVCTTLLLLLVTVVLVVVVAITFCNLFLEPSSCQTIKLACLRYVANVLEMVGAKVG